SCRSAETVGARPGRRAGHRCCPGTGGLRPFDVGDRPVSADSPLKNFTVRLSPDDHARLASLRDQWGLDRSATVRRLIRIAGPNALIGHEPFFTQIAQGKTGNG